MRPSWRILTWLLEEGTPYEVHVVAQRPHGFDELRHLLSACALGEWLS